MPFKTYPGTGGGTLPAKPWKPYRKPKKKPPKVVSQTVTPLSPQVRSSAEAEADRIIAELLQELGLSRDSARRESERSAQQEIARAQALSQALIALGIPAQIQGIYGNAAQSISGLASGFSGDVRSLAAAQGAEQANMVAGTGQEGAVRNEGTAMGDVLYGTQGFIPARGLEQMGAAFASEAALQPGFTLQFGGLAANKVMQDFASEVLPDFTDKEALIRTKRPSLVADAKERRKQEMFQLYEAGFVTQRDMARALGVPNWRKFPNTLPGDGPSKINASNSKLLGYLVDDYGNPIKDSKGKVIPIREDVKPNVRMWQDAYGAEWLIDLNTGKVTQLSGGKATPPILRGNQKDGYTIFDPETLQPIGTIEGKGGGNAPVTPKMRGQARRMARQAYRGIPKGPGTNIFGDPVEGQRAWKQRPMGYEEALDWLVSEGIPPDLAYKALNSFYKPGKRGRPKAEPPGGGVSFQPTSAAWGGSQSIASQVAAIATQASLVVSSEKRDRQNTVSGSRSDHWTGSTDSYAYDLSGTRARMDAAARSILASLGVTWSGGPIVLNLTRNGYRLQILYRTNVGGDHFDHIHIGVRRMG